MAVKSPIPARKLHRFLGSALESAGSDPNAGPIQRAMGGVGRALNGPIGDLGWKLFGRTDDPADPQWTGADMILGRPVIPGVTGQFSHAQPHAGAPATQNGIPEFDGFKPQGTFSTVLASSKKTVPTGPEEQALSDEMQQGRENTFPGIATPKPYPAIDIPPISQAPTGQMPAGAAPPQRRRMAWNPGVGGGPAVSFSAPADPMHPEFAYRVGHAPDPAAERRLEILRASTQQGQQGGTYMPDPIQQQKLHPAYQQAIEQMRADAGPSNELQVGGPSTGMYQPFGSTSTIQNEPWFRTRVAASNLGEPNLPAMRGYAARPVGLTTTDDKGTTTTKGGYGAIQARSRELSAQNDARRGLAPSSDRMGNVIAGSMADANARKTRITGVNPQETKYNNALLDAMNGKGPTIQSGPMAGMPTALVGMPGAVQAFGNGVAAVQRAVAANNGNITNARGAYIAQRAAAGIPPATAGKEFDLYVNPSGVAAGAGGATPAAPAGPGGTPPAPPAPPAASGGGAPAIPVAGRNPHLPPGYDSVDMLPPDHKDYPMAKGWQDVQNGNVDTEEANKYMEPIFNGAPIQDTSTVMGSIRNNLPNSWFADTPEHRRRFVDYAVTQGIPREAATKWLDRYYR